MHRTARAALLSALFVTTASAGFAQTWVRIFEDDFSSASGWTFAGVQNGGNDLIFVDGANQRVDASWDQSNLFTPGFPPSDIVPSSLSRPLGQTLTDADTFRFGATLWITPGSIPLTTEYHQIPPFGLYNLAEMGPDRTLADWTFPAAYKAGSDFVEFNYFPGNTSFGNASVSPVVGTHTDGTGWQDQYWFNFNPDSELAAGDFLPTGVPLFIEVLWRSDERRAYLGVYTDSDRTTLLSINGVSMADITPAVPAGEFFTLTDFAFFNYVGANFGGENTVGQGWFDDAYVDVLTSQIPEPSSLLLVVLGVGLARMAGGRRRT